MGAFLVNLAGYVPSWVWWPVVATGKWCYEHNWWPLRGWKERDDECERIQGASAVGAVTLTLTDLFCGAGGSSTGAVEVPGVSVRVASNHWERRP